MHYLMSVIDLSVTEDATDATATEPAPRRTGSATPAELAAVDVFNEQLVAAGHWVFAGGLGAPDTATVIDNRDGQAIVTDGPFVETKEYLAGFWIVEAPDLDVALELAAAGSKACNRKVEVRPFL